MSELTRILSLPQFIFQHPYWNGLLQEHQALPWVIEAYRNQAEYLMDGGKAYYYFAVGQWLAKAQQAYQEMGRVAEWQAYLDELLQKHQSKHKLVPLLKGLRC
jgi:uncharacterized Zn finger protein